MTGEMKKLSSSNTKNSEGQNKIEKTFKLTGKINTSNMVLYNSSGHLQKYSDANDILKDYFMVRHELYYKRKQYQIKSLAQQLK